MNSDRICRDRRGEERRGEERRGEERATGQSPERPPRASGKRCPRTDPTAPAGIFRSRLVPPRVGGGSASPSPASIPRTLPTLDSSRSGIAGREIDPGTRVELPPPPPVRCRIRSLGVRQRESVTADEPDADPHQDSHTTRIVGRTPTFTAPDSPLGMRSGPCDPRGHPPPAVAFREAP